MSNLANQYISSSYQSVLNIGTTAGSSLSSSLQPVTDGYGLSSPLSLATDKVAINGTLLITGSIVPQGSGSWDIGSQTNPFRHGYFSSGSLYLDNNRILGLDNVNNTTLAAPSGNSITFVNDIIFDAITGSGLYGGGKFIMQGRGNPSSTTTVYNDSIFNFIQTDGNLFWNNRLDNFDTTSTGSFGFGLFNGGQFGIDAITGSVQMTTQMGQLNMLATGSEASINLVSNGFNNSFNISVISGSMEFVQNSPSRNHTYNIAAKGLSHYEYGTETLQWNIGAVDVTGSLFDNELLIQGDSTGLQWRDWDNDSQSYQTWLTQLPNNGDNPRPIFNRGIISTGSVSILKPGGGVGLDVQNGGITAQGNINSNNSVNVLNQYGGINIMANENYSGSQYPIYNAAVDTGLYGSDIFGGYQVTDNAANTIIAMAANTYTPEFGGQNVGWIGGGGNNPSGSNTAIIFPTGSGTMHVYKPTNFHFGEIVTGSVNILGSQTVIGTSVQTFNEPGNNNEVQVVRVNSYTDSQGYTMANNTFGWYHYNGEGHEGFASNLYTADYAYGSAWFHDPDKFEYILFPSGSAYDTNKFGLYDNGNTTTSFVVVADNSQITGSLAVVGSSKSTNSFTQVKMSTGQTVTAGTDTVVNFDTINVNNNGWFNTSTHVFTPTVAGTYEISFAILVAPGTGAGQMNAQINKNNGTQLFIVQDEVNKDQNRSLVGSILVDMNGSTDNIRITFYTSSNTGNQVIQDNNGSFFKAVLL